MLHTMKKTSEYLGKSLNVWFCTQPVRRVALSEEHCLAFFGVHQCASTFLHFALTTNGCYSLTLNWTICA